GVDDEIFSKCLLQAGVKLIAEARSDRRRNARNKSRDHREVAPNTGDDEVFVEGTFERARVRNAKNRVARLDVICNAEARLRLVGLGNSTVHVTANSEIE